MFRGLVLRAMVMVGLAAGAVIAGLPAVAAPAATPACKEWQTPAARPPGVVFTPRVFPSDQGGSTLAATDTSAAKPATVCRNAPPRPFARPAWDPSSVVGGPQLGGEGVAVDESVPPPPDVYDVSYVVADLDTGEILAAKSPHAWLRPASTLKVLTALTLLPRLDPAKVVIASPEAAGASGSRVGILEDNPYSVSSLVDAMVMASANDAVYALADAAGGYDKTVSLMNAKAKEVGAYDTVVVDPSGLDDGDQRSSAYDLAVIGRAAMKLPQFRAAVVKRDAVFPGGKGHAGKVWPAFHIGNLNELLGRYPGAIGIKPGRTDRAQHTYIGAATRNGRTLIVTQMGSITGSWKPTAALLDWGFAHAGTIRPVGQLMAPGEASPPSPVSTAWPASPTTVSAGPGDTPTGSRSPTAPSTVAAAPGQGSGPLDNHTAVMIAGVGVSVLLALLAGTLAVVIRRRLRAQS